MSDSDENKPVAVDIMAEHAAAGKVLEAVKGLNPDAVARVLGWAAGAFGVTLGSVPKSKATGSPTVAENGNGNGNTPQFSELGDLFSTASPTTDADRALVVGYWFQFQQGQADFGAFEVNAALNNMGERVKNITTAFDTLKARKPADVIQLKKSGTSKQARKTYKVTLHGKAAVEAMLGQQP